MKKKLPYIATSYFLVRASFIGLSFKHILLSTNQNIVVGLLLAIIIGFIPIKLVEYIASYKSELPFREKCISLFPKSHFAIIWMLIIGFIGFGAMNFANLITFVNSQFLDKTPYIVIGLSFLIPLCMIINQKDHVIPRVAFVLFAMSIFLFIISFLGLIPNLDINNFTSGTSLSFMASVFYFLGCNVCPLFLLLIFPNGEIKKTIKSGYVIASISLFISAISTLGILGINLSSVYQYPEFHVLKGIFNQVLTFQLSNILAIQWLFDIFILCAVILKFCNNILSIHDVRKYSIPTVLFLVSLLLVNNISPLTLQIISSFFIGMILLFSMKIIVKK